MKAIFVMLLASAPALALAQNAAGSAPATAPVANTCTPEHAAMGHCKLPAPAPPAADPVAAPVPKPTVSCTPEHAAMGHCTLPAAAPPAADPHTGHNMAGQPPATAVPRAADTVAPAPAATAPATTCTPEHAAMGHCTLQPAPAAADPHAGHDMSDAGVAPTPPDAPPPAAAFSGPENGADAFYGRAEMAEAREEMVGEHGGMKTYRFLIDRLEARIGKGADGYAWDAEAWYGGDINKLWVTTEGEGEFGGGVEEAELQALWSRAIDPWFDLQLGVRQDFQPGPDRSHLVAGVQGLAPYWFEVEAMAFVSNKGEVSARFEGEYDLRLTRALILQPMVEFNLALQDSPEIGVGSGLSTAEVGARLRYELFPSSGPAVIAPYVGVEYERAFGDTARFRRAAGEDAGGWRILAGLRTWF